MAAAGFFYLFAVLAVAAGAMVLLAKNPVHAVLFLSLIHISEPTRPY